MYYLKIKTIQLENFKGISRAAFGLDGKTTVFFGINGVGKSTVLRATNLLFSSMINKIVLQRFKQGINIELSDITFGKPSCSIDAEFLFSDGVVESYGRYMKRLGQKRTQDNKTLDEIRTKFRSQYIDDENQNMPLFVNYGTNRLVVDIPLRIRTKHIFDKESAFEKSIESKIDFRTFFEWFRYQEDVENQFKARGNLQYTDKSLAAVKEAITAMLDNVTNLRVERSPRLAMKVDKEGISLTIEQLSDGEKCTLALIGDLSRRLSLANPTLNNPNHGEGIVLIDEIELHMHPSWQRKILDRLIKTFPHIQFIITTHSPQVLGEIGEDINIFKLSREKNAFCCEKFSGMQGWDSNYILEDFMGTSALNQTTKGVIAHMFELISKKDYQAASEYATKLEKMTDSAHEDVVKARILIARGKRGI